MSSSIEFQFLIRYYKYGNYLERKEDEVVSIPH